MRINCFSHICNDFGGRQLMCVVFVTDCSPQAAENGSFCADPTRHCYSGATGSWQSGVALLSPLLHLRRTWRRTVWSHWSVFCSLCQSLAKLNSIPLASERIHLLTTTFQICFYVFFFYTTTNMFFLSRLSDCPEFDIKLISYHHCYTDCNLALMTFNWLSTVKYSTAHAFSLLQALFVQCVNCKVLYFKLAPLLYIKIIVTHS